MTQERLSTGKKVNSAIDNPSSYYTAQSLNNRANDLSSLLDNMGQGIQTIKAADEALTAITSFAEQAKAIANSARDVVSNFDKFAITSNEISEGVAGSFIVDARDDMSAFTLNLAAADRTTDGKKFTVYYGDNQKHEIVLSATNIAGTELTDVTSYVVNQLQGIGLNAVADPTGAVKVSSTDGSAISWVNDSTAGIATATSAAKVVTLVANGNGANSATIAGAITAAGAGGGKLTAAADGKFFSVQAQNTQFRIFSDGTNASADALDKLGIAGSRKAGDASVKTLERSNYAKQFNDILGQIDALAKDAGYKGINLLQENDLRVVFNEDRSSYIDIEGVDASASGLGISQAQNDWQKNSNIETAITHIENAITKLRTISSEFGNNYSVVQAREDFTDNLINVLTEGADKLTLADMNEESANMLALQTRQQLAINSLSLASQAAQSVLQLF